MAREEASHVVLSGPKGDAPASTGTADRPRGQTPAENQGWRTEPRHGPTDNPNDDASPLANSWAGLKALLSRFKAARFRRDDAVLGSPEWSAADDDIRMIQHEIFVVRLDDQVPENGNQSDAEDESAPDQRDGGAPPI